MKIAALKNMPRTGFTWNKFHLPKKIWIPALVLIVLAAGGLTAWRLTAKTTPTTTTTATVQTTVARTGSLTIYASGAGSVVAASEVTFGFENSGTLSELLVKVGDKVTSGQVLARLKTTNTEASLAAAIASAQLAVLNAQNNLDTLKNSAETTTADALKAGEDAQKNLDTVQNSTLSAAEAEQAVANAQQAVIDAQYAYDLTQQTASQATIDQYYAAMILAKNELAVSQARFDEVSNLDKDNIKYAQAQSRLSTSQDTYNKAVWNYQSATATATDTEKAVAAADLAAAKATLVNARQDYDLMKNGPTAGQLAVAKAALSAAQLAYVKVKDGADPQEVAIDEATLTNAQAQLALAKEKTVVEELDAPMEGTVLSISGNVGESVGSSFITLANLSQPMVTIYVDETDMDKVSLGLEADVTFDALPDQTFTGKVVQINPSLQSASGVMMVEAKVQLDSTSYAKATSLMIGMTASADIIGGKAVNAVLVPVEALRKIDTDTYAVFVMKSGQASLRTVTVGLQDLTSAQIISGLSAGEIVTTGTVQTTTKSTTN